MQLAIEEMLRYTDEERTLWERWFRENGEELLKMPILGDRENSIGALILNIFGPEMRMVQRARGDALSEYRHRPCHHIQELFGFGMETRNCMRMFVEKAAPEDWERQLDMSLSGKLQKVSVRKVILHVLIHEIGHWAQVARLMLERGFVPPLRHDLLRSSALA
jgi:hypothetical protein